LRRSHAVNWLGDYGAVTADLLSVDCC